MIRWKTIEQPFKIATATSKDAGFYDKNWLFGIIFNDIEMKLKIVKFEGIAVKKTLKMCTLWTKKKVNNCNI